MVQLCRTASRTVRYRLDFEMRKKIAPSFHIDTILSGICGGSASGKTTVAQKIIESLDVPWVTLLSMDCFYKVNLKNENFKSASTLQLTPYLLTFSDFE